MTRPHIQDTAANCPNTRIVLGGFSQGAVVAGFVTVGRRTGGSTCCARTRADAAGGG